MSSQWEIPICRGTADLPHVLTACVRDVGVTGGGVPRQGGDTDGAVRTFFTLPRAVHRDNRGGGQLTQYIVIPMWHAGTMDGPKYPSPISAQREKIGSGTGWRRKRPGQAQRGP